MNATPMRPMAHPKPTRPAIVLLHASGSSARQWEPLAERLRATHDVHAIDLHDHGRGPAWTGTRPLSVGDDARLVADVLERTRGAHVIGHSYGGAVALHVAAVMPQRVHSLALYEPAVFSLLATRPETSAAAREIADVAATLRRLVDAAKPAEASAVFVDYWSGAGSWQRLSADQQRTIVGRIPATLAHFDALIGEALPADATRRLSMPMLVLHGARTVASAHAIASLLAADLPAATHAQLPGMGHMGPVTHAARVNERLLRFLGVDAAQAAEPAALAA